MIFLLAVMLIVASLGNVKSDWKDIKEAVGTEGMLATNIFAEGEEQDSVTVKFKTIQTVSSDEEYVKLSYFDEEGDPKGNIQIYFGLPKISTELTNCQDSPVEISANLPDEVEKVWTVVRTTDYRMLVHCNGVEVLNFLLSDETCPYEYDWFGTMKRWDSAWQGEVHHIKLRSSTIGVLSEYMMPMESCNAGQFLDAADFCKDCPENQWSANENDDACTLCPEGRKVGAGLGKAEIDCKFESTAATSISIPTSMPTAAPPSRAQTAAPSVPCGEDEHTCADDGQCWALSWVCDGENQCGDGSDEADCDAIPCGEDEHTCADDGQCWALSFVCDGENQCGDGSDEADCEESTAAPAAPGSLPTFVPTSVPINVLCGEDEYTCADDGQCWALSFVCDGENQCGDGSDEADCEETCDPEEAEVVIPGGSFVSEREEGMSYKDGDTVNYICNENFAMEGNPFVVCSGRKFNSEPPKCTAVNTNCDEFTVENGKLGINHPYLTNDEVQVTCETDFIPDGTNPRKCVENGWEDAAPVCVTDDGTQCVPLSPPKNGDFTCSGLDEGKAVAGSKCSVFCKESFLAVEDAVKETTCEDDSFTWTHQNPDNPLGELQPCMAMIAPEEKMLSNEVTIKSLYCQSEDEKKAIADALKTFLQETLSISCFGEGVCEVNDVLCTPGSDDIVLNFDVVQTSDMLNLEVLEEAKTKITNSVSSETFTLTIDDGKRRRKRAVTMSADKDSLKVEEKVTCGAGEVIKDGVCVKCPAGYKTVDGACVACEIATYNAAVGASDCIACEGEKTTYGTGSTKVDQCFDLCTVPDIPGGSLNKEAGFKVEPNYYLALTCDDGYTNSVECGSYSASTHFCTVHGGWSDYGDWGECECKTGTESRTRRCTNPAPLHGGDTCEGDANEMRNCNTVSCNNSHEYSDAAIHKTATIIFVASLLCLLT